MAGWETVCELGGELPEVEEGTWYGTPALKVRGTGFARLREDGALVVMVDVLEREALMQEGAEAAARSVRSQVYVTYVIERRG